MGVTRSTEFRNSLETHLPADQFADGKRNVARGDGLRSMSKGAEKPPHPKVHAPNFYPDHSVRLVRMVNYGYYTRV